MAVKSSNISQASGYPKHGFVTAGLVCSIIAVALGAICLITTVCTCISAASVYSSVPWMFRGW